MAHFNELRDDDARVFFEAVSESMEEKAAELKTLIEDIEFDFKDIFTDTSDADETDEQDIKSYPTKMKARVAAKNEIDEYLEAILQLLEQEKDNYLEQIKNKFSEIDIIISDYQENFHEVLTDGESLLCNDHHQGLNTWLETDESYKVFKEGSLPAIREEELDLFRESYTIKATELKDKARLYIDKVEYSLVSEGHCFDDTIAKLDIKNDANVLFSTFVEEYLNNLKKEYFDILHEDFTKAMLEVIEKSNLDMMNNYGYTIEPEDFINEWNLWKC